MSWRDALIANLPSGDGDKEPANLRQDILDELSDHLDCAMQRESTRHEGEASARKAVLKRFGNPAAIARRLWLDAMKESVMNQRIMIGTNIVLAVIVFAMFIIVLVSMRQNQQFQAALVERLAEIAAPAAEAPEQAAPVMPVATDAGAMSWPSVRIHIEGGNAPFRLQLQGEPYNPGERLILDQRTDDGETTFGPIRPGRYTLTVYDTYSARHHREVVVPPGGVSEVLVQAPNWQPQPTETRMRVDLPDDLAERLNVMVVFGMTRGHVVGHEEAWRYHPHLIVTADGRAAAFGTDPLSPTEGIIWSKRVPSSDRGTRYRINVDDLDLQEHLVLDASLRYRAQSARLLYPTQAVDRTGVVYRTLLLGGLTIEPEEIATGEVRISLDLPEEMLAHLRSAADALENPCRAMGGHLAGGHENMCYILHGAEAGHEAPEDGYKLLVVLPGGDGSAEFRNFVRLIHSEALVRKGYIIAQAIAPVWDHEQPEQVVWPTQGLPWPNMEFSTEEFIAAIIDDVAEQYPINENHIYALGWASGGPPVYATAMQEDTQLRGAFIAMSVFHPNQYPPVENASGRSFYILHSPDDFIAMRFPEQARDTLSEAGARVQLDTYEGGHGWHGDVYAMIRRGIEWLEEDGQ